MAIKCTGADFKRFCNDPTYWITSDRVEDDGTWYDQALLYINNVEQPDDIEIEQLKDADIVTIKGGVVFGRVVGTSEPSLESYFKRWKKERNTTSIVVDCPKEKLDAILEAIKAAGGYVQK